MQELIINNKLISKIQWEKSIKIIKKDNDILIKEESKALKLLEDELFNSIKKRTNKEFRILFSGGIDSVIIALVCKKLKYKFKCYSIGFKDSSDLVYAKKIAKQLNLKLEIKSFTLKEFEILLKKVVKLFRSSDPVKIGIASVNYAAIEFAKKDKNLFSGLGAEEIFAGYHRHRLAKDLEKESWKGLRNMYEVDIKRDLLISRYFKINLLTPFLDDKLIKIAMKIHPNLKIKDNTNKYILRRLALKLGLKKEFAFRPKKAAQYGTNFDKAILKLTKLNGFKYKRDYLASLIRS